ncbi:MAG: SpoIIE family protein phosphatase [Candidatus Dadabacteria bacterium]|nr:SpoIIE family protein phosphatase [Candidatus Dadabacteria bacterium]
MDDGKIRILVVDDEIDLEQLMLQRMRREVRRGRYEFEFAHNGVEALERLRNDDGFDIVLSDINMPVMDGLTLLAQIPDVDPDIRAVMVSAYGDMENIRTAMNRGAFDFVTKPIDFTDLKTTIERTIENLAMWRKALSARDKLVALQNELDVARTMQQDILPKSFPTSETFDLYASMVPALSVGGDFFDVYEFSDGRVGVAIADVSGKGVPAAMFMMASRTLLKACAAISTSPAAVLEQVNTMLAEDNDAMTFVTLLYGIYDPGTKEFVYANGGHNPPVIVKPNLTTELLESTGGVALGVMPNFKYEENTVTIESGSMIVFYTDGVVEAEKKDKELFEMDRFCEIFQSGTFKNSEEVTNEVFETVKEFAGENPQSDDITCLVLRTT